MRELETAEPRRVWSYCKSIYSGGSVVAEIRPKEKLVSIHAARVCDCACACVRQSGILLMMEKCSLAKVTDFQSALIE